jgi:hypothetical protein
MSHRLLVVIVIALLGEMLWFAPADSQAAPIGDPAFQRTWARTDQPVIDGIVDRTWMWGPSGFSEVFAEPYAESPGGMRTVQYFDKSRMEITNPEAVDDGVWYVSNGLLVNELVAGRVQVGDDQFIDAQPAQVNIAGDPGERPSYADINAWALQSETARPIGTVTTHRIDDNGNVSLDSDLAQFGVTAAERVAVPGIDHSVASVFWDFMTSQDVVFEDDQYLTANLFENAFYATGYPITEAWWSRISVDGLDHDLLWQCFERRCLTYTPSKVAEWRVEAGNVGQHYYRWRYGDESIRALSRDRAIAAYESMQEHFYVPGVQLFRETAPTWEGNPYAYHWPFSRAVAATSNLAWLQDVGSDYLDDLQDRIAGSEPYWDSGHEPPGYASYVVAPLGGGGDLFYDDNAWTGLNLVKIYRLTNDAAIIERARQVFDVLVTGWDDDSSHPAPGGVFWVDAGWNRDRNVVSTGTAAQLGLHLYELTGEQRYLDWALRMYEWVYAYLLAPNGLFWDHIDLAGRIEMTQWSYNQGTMIGVNVLLARITGEEMYDERAVTISDAALAYFGEDDRLFGQPPEFLAIYFENLMLLYSVHPDPALLDSIRSYADRVWETRRDPTTGLFTFSNPVRLQEHSAVVHIFALLAWVPEDYARIA